MKNSNLIISGGLEIEDFDDQAEGTSDVELRALIFGALQHGVRLDRALVDLVPEFSRSYLQQLIELEGVKINGVVVRKAATRIKASDKGSIELRPTPQSQAFKPEAMPLDIVFEDAFLMVINKPVGLVVHPAPGNWSGTLLNGLLAYNAEFINMPRAGIVHRLDKDTSGLMVVAKTRATMDALIKAIADREVGRKYLALANRTWVGARSVEITQPIGRDPRNRLRMAVVDLTKNQGKLAKTEVEMLQNCAQGCLVRCTLHTGRTHQIRVHMAYLGHPLVADEVYAGLKAAGMDRQALHAYRLAFTHPQTRELMAFTSEVPADFRAALLDWGLSYNEN